MAVLIALVIVVLIAVFLWVHDRRINRHRPRRGDAAPSFSLPDQNGDARSLDEFRGKPLVLYFYPRDDTPGCAEQAMRFRDAMREFEALGASVCGVSVNGTRSHAAFAVKYKLPFPLLSDKSGTVSARYGSIRDFGFWKIAKRNTFLIDGAGKVSQVYVGVNAGRNARQVLEDLRQPPAR
jgi:peroxiredoxin Q/BCP